MYGDDNDVGSIAIEQPTGDPEDCNLVHGFGEGLAHWLPEVEDVWSFYGRYVQPSEESGISMVELNIVGGGDLWAFRRRSGDVEELILRREGVLDDAVLVPERCPSEE